MIHLKPFVLCSLLFIWGNPSKALDEAYWSKGAFLVNEVQHLIQGGGAIDDKEISATALEIWNSEGDQNVQYDGIKHGEEPRKLFTKDQGALRLDQSFEGLFGFYTAKTGVEDPCVRMHYKDCKVAQNLFIENISRINGPIWKLHQFLIKKSLAEIEYKGFKESLQKMWFTPYNRFGGTVRDSSAFEHVFLGERTQKGADPQKGTVSGLHNWMRMYYEERGGRFQLTENADYFPAQPRKPIVASVKFTWDDYVKTKPGSSFFMKRSPAVEIALYTLCFKVRPDIREKSCPISFGTDVVKVIAISLDTDKNLISTAYPEFPKNTMTY